MANWRDFKAFVKHRYDVEQERPDMLQLMLDAGSERSQVVYLWHRRLMKGTEDWLIIESPFAARSSVHPDELDKLLGVAGDMVCGGIVAIGKHVFYRHALPLENMDVNEFERPLRLVTLSADRLEQQVTDGDNF